MATEFNPYHVWLGIPPDEQPANHYRLLGLRAFEANGDVIDSAADRQMAHLRTFQSGKHGELTQRLLNEVAAARVCLLDPKKRAAYDQQFPAASASAAQAAAGSAIRRQPPPPPVGPVVARPVPSIPVAQPQPAIPWDDLLGAPTAKPLQSKGNLASPEAAKEKGARPAASRRNILIGIAGAVALVVAGAIGLFLSRGSAPPEGALVFPWPIAERADLTVTVDGKTLPVPASDSWEYACPAGQHHIVAQRRAFKLDAKVDVAAGEKLSVPSDWTPKATLVLNWPPPLRSGAELRVDGHTQRVSTSGLLEIPVEPGDHRVQIARPGWAPFSATASVAADGRSSVNVALAPMPAMPAKLVFNWSSDQRISAELVIDGSRQTVPLGSGSASFALTVSPGEHVLRLTRTGFEPFNQTIDVAAGANQSVSPIWTPESKAAPTVAVVDKPKPIATAPVAPAKKLPIPPAAEQARIAKQLDELYKTSHPGAKDAAKPQELYDVADKAGVPPSERYMLLMKGAELAATAGDLNLSLQGVDALDGEYELNALELKQKLLEKFITAGKPDQVAIAIPASEQLIDQAVAADQYELALAFAATTARAAAKSKSAIRKEIEERLSRRRRDIHLTELIYAASKKAQATLHTNPADPEANLIAGRWLCWYKQDWTAGLPLLAKGSDEKLKSLSADELKASTDVNQQVRLADSWWDLAQKEVGLARDSIHLHAGNLYQAAMPNLTSALKKAAIEKRLTAIVDIKPLEPAAGSTNANGPVSLQFAKWTYAADESGLPGYFARQNGEWIEMKNGKIWAHFRLAARNADFVELFDAGRGLRVRLTPTEASWSRDKTWHFLVKGTPAPNP